MTLGEQLKDLQEAAHHLLTGKIKSYKVGEQEVTRLDMRPLFEAQEKIISQIQQLGANYDPLLAEHIKDGRVRISFNG